MYADLIVTNISTIYSPYKKPPVHGQDMMSIHEINHAYLAVRDGMIMAIGSGDYQKHLGPETIIHDADHKIMIPGLIDSHTHLVHGGSRETEYKRLIAGTPYLQILAEGGGILGTVEATRKASFNDLFDKAKKSLNEMMLHGVTTVESKSGYGLNLDTEMKQLKVNKKLNEKHPVHVVSTYMGAHAVPKEFKEDKDLYIDQLLLDMEIIKSENLAEAVDVFCEAGVFSVKETKKILKHAKKIGFKVKLHADEIHPLGGAGLGVELEATSVDHLMAISDHDIKRLADSDTVANILPGTSFYLRKKYAHARKMIDNNVAVSIAGDYNPGSCPTENFQFIMQLASNQLQMMPEEVLNAVTINPAYHLGIHNEKGSLEIGKSADFVIMDAPNLTYILYHYGINHTSDVYIEGKPVVLNRQIVR